MIGQNLVDIAQPESATKIADCLKPSVVLSVAKSNNEEETTVSQFRQFYVKFKPTSKSASYPVSDTLYTVYMYMVCLFFLFLTLGACAEGYGSRFVCLLP